MLAHGRVDFLKLVIKLRPVSFLSLNWPLLYYLLRLYHSNIVSSVITGYYVKWNIDITKTAYINANKWLLVFLSYFILNKYSVRYAQKPIISININKLYLCTLYIDMVEVGGSSPPSPTNSKACSDSTHSGYKNYTKTPHKNSFSNFLYLLDNQCPQGQGCTTRQPQVAIL